jgi:hypothetical protein
MRQGSEIGDQGSGTDDGPRVPQVSRLRPRKATGLLIVVLAAFVAVIPQLVRGNSCGHDFDVHLVSWLDCANAWKHGLLYPHWTPSANHGAGEPRFVFYPPLTWMLGAALGLLLPWWLAPIALTFLTLAGTGLATRALALEACADAVATLAGCASIFSGFALFTAYERSAFPEFMGGVWLPLVLLFALRERNGSEAKVDAIPPCRQEKIDRMGHGGDARWKQMLRRAFEGSTVPLALVLGCAWLSNAPLGVIASYLLAAVALLAAGLRRSWAPVVRAAVAMALGLGVIAAYLLPAALERAWVDIRQAYLDPGYNFENNWAFARHADPALALHDQVLRQASMIGVTMIAVALAALFICWRRGVLPAQKSNEFERWWVMLAAIPVVVLVLLFPVSRPLWYVLPEWRFLQYPWRWLEAVEAPMAIFFAAAVWPSASRFARQWRWAVACGCGAAFLGALAYTNAAFFQVCYPEDTVASTLADYRADTGFEGMYEYAPPDSDLELIPMELPAACLVTDAKTTLGKVDDDGDLVWSADQGSCVATFAADDTPRSDPEHMRIHATTPESGYLVLRLLNYPAWRVQMNGRLLTNLEKRDDGLMAFAAPQGPVNVEVDWTTTPDVTVSRWLSAVCALLLAFVFILERRSRAGARLS